MERRKFLVQGSQEEPYTVTFEKNGSNINAFCTCPAGGMGQVCKHRFGILFAVTDGIVSGNIEDVAVVCGWIPGSDIEQAMANIELAEEDVLRAKKKLSAAKKGLAKAFRT